MSSSDEEPYCRRMVNSFELNRCTDRSNLVNSSGLETGDLQLQSLASADSDTMDCLPFPVMERAQVFAWERES